MLATSPSTIQSVELNRLQLSQSLAEKIEAVFGVPKSWLINNNLRAPLPRLSRLHTMATTDPEQVKREAFQLTALILEINSRIGKTGMLNLLALDLQKFSDRLEQGFFGSRKELNTEIIKQLKTELASLERPLVKGTTRSKHQRGPNRNPVSA